MGGYIIFGFVIVTMIAIMGWTIYSDIQNKKNKK